MWISAAAASRTWLRTVCILSKPSLPHITCFESIANLLLCSYTVFQNGSISPSGGTSAAAPVTASIVALLNDARLRAGKPVLGFLNPLLYLGGYEGFTDITSGFSIGCTGNDTQTGAPVPGAGVIPGAFWNATVGWDPVTGFGVPNFGELLKLVMEDKW